MSPLGHGTAAHLDRNNLQGARVAGQHAVQGDGGVGSVEVHAGGVGGQARPLVGSVHQLQQQKESYGQEWASPCSSRHESKMQKQVQKQAGVQRRRLKGVAAKH